MEVDSEQSMPARVTQLENRLDDLAKQQETIQDSATQHAVDTSLQAQGLQPAFQQQHDQLERAIAMNSAQFQEQFQQQSKQHETMLNGLFCGSDAAV